MQRRQVAGNALVLGQAFARLAGLGVQAHAQRRHRNHARQIDDQAEDQFLQGEVPGEDGLPCDGRQDAQVAEQRDAHEEQGACGSHVTRPRRHSPRWIPALKPLDCISQNRVGKSWRIPHECARQLNRIRFRWADVRA